MKILNDAELALQIAEKSLPCSQCAICTAYKPFTYHQYPCPAWFRPIVARAVEKVIGRVRAKTIDRVIDYLEESGTGNLEMDKIAIRALAAQGGKVDEDGI